jgi:hypothetical protein
MLLHIALQAAAADKAGLENNATETGIAAALEMPKFPGVKINPTLRCVDIEGTVCLRRGPLELVACTKGTKEHESIFAMEAKAMHVHTALLLLGAKAGSPATRIQADGKDGRWVDVPPRGSPVDVYLVFEDKEGKPGDHPVSEFIVSSKRERGRGDDATQPIQFPTHTFLFAGSLLEGDGPNPRRYLCDASGNVISIATFGDELLCLPEIHSQDNASLEWEVHSTALPAPGKKVILRLRPHISSAAKVGNDRDSVIFQK